MSNCSKERMCSSPEIWRPACSKQRPLVRKECRVKKVTQITAALTVGGGRRSFRESEEVLMRRHPSVGQCGHLSLARARTNRPRFTAAQWGGESVTSAKLRLFYFPSTQDPGRRDCIFILIFFQDQLKMYWSYWSNCCGVGSVIISKSCCWWMMLI